MQHIGDLEVEQDLTFQRRAWVIQRIGWAVMLLLTAAAIAGLIGPGPLSNASAITSDESFEAKYLRFARHRSPTRVTFELAPSVVTDTEVTIAIRRDYLSGTEVQDIYPEPESVESGSDTVTYTFQVEEPRQPVIIIFNMMHDATGVRRARATLNDTHTVSFWQMIYP